MKPIFISQIFDPITSWDLWFYWKIGTLPELGARVKVRKRDLSLQTVTEEGTKANDAFMTIVQTARKLGISAYQYMFDRVSKTFEMPSLAQLIREKSTLSWKWTVFHSIWRGYPKWKSNGFIHTCIHSI